MKRSSRTSSAFTMLAAIVIFVAANLIANVVLSRYRIDLTEHHLYTLSEGTAKVISDLKEPVKLRFFYSEATANGYPQIQAYGNRVKGILKEYVKQSGGKLQLEIINPEPFTEDEDLAMKLGVKSLPLDDAGTKLYFGLIVTNSVDEIGSIPFFDPDRAAWLEYDVTRIIYDLNAGKKPTIGVMTWLPLYGSGSSASDMQGKWAILDQISKSFQTEYVEKDAKEIPGNIDVLMVVNPVNMSQDTQYAVDQFVLKGGRALIFTDPYTNMRGLERSSSELTRLYNAWGIDMPATDMVLDRTLAIRMADGDRGSALRTVSNPSWLALTSDNFAKDDLITSALQLIRVVAAGHFVYKDAGTAETGAGGKTSIKHAITMEPLIFTGKDAMVTKSFELMVNKDPSQFLNDYKPGGTSLVLAARLTGKAHTAFPERKDKDHVAESKGDIHVIVVGDSDMLQDGFWANMQAIAGSKVLVPTAHNGAFVMNALDHLSGSGDLIGLRSRSDYDRPFKKVETIRADAEVKFRNREQELRVKLTELEQKLRELQSGNKHEDGDLLVTEAQQRELFDFRDQILATRQELRSVQRALIVDIDALGYKLKVINIAGIAFIVVLLAFFLPRRLGVKRS